MSREREKNRKVADLLPLSLRSYWGVMDDSRISTRPKSAPTTERRSRRGVEETLWLGHTPMKHKKVNVMTIEAVSWGWFLDVPLVFCRK